MNVIIYAQVKATVITIKTQTVILNNGVADLLGVETRDINKAVKNSYNKFPAGYVFELNTDKNRTSGKFPPVQ